VSIVEQVSVLQSLETKPGGNKKHQATCGKQWDGSFRLHSSSLPGNNASINTGLQTVKREEAVLFSSIDYTILNTQFLDLAGKRVSAPAKKCRGIPFTPSAMLQGYLDHALFKNRSSLLQDT